MRHDFLYAKHHKAHSTPFHKSLQGFDGWVRSLQSLDQHSYDVSDIQSLRQYAVPKNAIRDHESDIKYIHNESKSTGRGTRET
jgi:hypothetical protein